MDWFSAIAVYFFLIQIFFRGRFFWVQLSLENAKLEQRVGRRLNVLARKNEYTLEVRCSMTSRGLLRAEAEPPGLRSTIQRFQLQTCRFSVNDADGV